MTTPEDNSGLPHDKHLTEVAVCSKFLYYLHQKEQISFTSVRHLTVDRPPHFEALHDDIMVGIKLAELDKKPTWNTDSLCNEINKRVWEKDNPAEKELLRKNYHKYILLLHTEKDCLNRDVFKKHFDPDRIYQTQLINEIYMLFSNGPSSTHSEVIKIR